MKHDEICKTYFEKTLDEMSDAELCKHFVAYDKILNGDCFGSNDIALFSILESELAKRDIDCITEKDYMFIDKAGNEVK